MTIETIGTCEDCGLLDHHLVAGICALCAPKSRTLEALPDVPLQPIADACEPEALLVLMGSARALA